MTTRDAILNLLRSGPKTSWELCQGAKTSRYGGRIFELRKMGYDIQIQTKIGVRPDGSSITQRIYVLVSEPTVEARFHKQIIKPLVDLIAEEIGIGKVPSYKFKQGRLL